MTPKIDSLESERLLLEIRQEFHASELYELFCEKDLYPYINRNVPPSKEWLAAGFKKLESQASADGKEIWLAWVGKDKTTKLPIGLFEITIIEDEAFIAYTVFKSYWGKGYAVEATQAVIDYIGKNFKLSRFIIEMDTRNRNSVKSLRSWALSL